jgi:hypothetical protein
MKNLVTLLLCISLSCFIKSQTLDTAPWCPPGATWVYSFGTWGAITFNEYKYVKDTIYKGVTAKKIEHNWVTFNGPTYPYNKVVSYLGDEFLYLSNDSLFYFDPITNEYVFYFNFNANISVSLDVKNPREECLSNSFFPNTDTLNILSIENDTISNLVFRVFKLNDIVQYKNYIIGDIYKNIGSSYSFLPRINPANCISPSSANSGEALVCYYDSMRGYLFQGTLLLDCNDIWSGNTYIKEQNGTDFHLNIYPNPSNGYLWVDVDNNNEYDYTIFDYSGKFIQNGKTQGGKINVLEIKNGLYYIKFQSDKTTFLARFVRI